LKRNPKKLAQVAARCVPTQVTTQQADFNDLAANEQVVAESE